MEQDIRTSYETGQHNDVPVIAGANGADTPGLIEGNETEVFAYVFDHLPQAWRETGTQAYHGIELVYVFDYYGSFLSHYLLGLTGKPATDAISWPAYTSQNDAYLLIEDSPSIQTGIDNAFTGSSR